MAEPKGYKLFHSSTGTPKKMVAKFERALAVWHISSKRLTGNPNGYWHISSKRLTGIGTGSYFYSIKRGQDREEPA